MSLQGDLAPLYSYTADQKCVKNIINQHNITLFVIADLAISDTVLYRMYVTDVSDFVRDIVS